MAVPMVVLMEEETVEVVITEVPITERQDRVLAKGKDPIQETVLGIMMEIILLTEKLAITMEALGVGDQAMGTVILVMVLQEETITVLLVVAMVILIITLQIMETKVTILAMEETMVQEEEERIASLIVVIR